MNSAVETLEEIKKHIYKSDAKLVAVSKTRSVEEIMPLLKAGHRLFGENRVEEARSKYVPLKEAYPDIKLHLIGHLQSRKVKQAVALFDVIETLDSEKLARKLAKEMKAQNRQLPCFIQVNTGEEPQKHGIYPKELTEFIDFTQKECGLDIIGLMCIPPRDEPAFIHFAFLSELAQRHKLPQLSMGMSGDYEIAIKHGATYIRIGTALFGKRSNI